MDDSSTTPPTTPTAATLNIVGGNDDSLPPIDKATEISVWGSGFPPGVVVALSVVAASAPMDDSVTVDADGNIGWARAVKPPVNTNMIIGARATYPSDPTDPNSAALVVEARGKVEKVDGHQT